MSVEYFLGVQTEPEEVVNKYGIIDGERVSDRMYRVHDMGEKPDPEHAPSHVAVLGRHIITPEIFPLLETQGAGKGGEIQSLPMH